MSIKRFIHSIVETNSKKALERIEGVADRHAARWTTHIQDRLSRDTSKFKHSVRQPRTALFPGAVRDLSQNPLRRKVYAKRLTTQKLGEGHYKVKIHFYGAKSKEARFTNIGVNQPKKVATGHWVGWVDDIFGSTDRGGILSIKSVMDRVLKIYANTRSVKSVR